MRLTMSERRTVTKVLAGQYRRASKKEKGRILERFVEGTGYHRVYAAWLLRGHGKRVEVAPGVAVEGRAECVARKERPRTYGPQVLKALKKVWKTLDYISSKRLAAALPDVVPRMKAQGELRASQAVVKKLLTVSPATIDRLLKPEREKYTLKGRHGTKPGTLLKHQIPVRTFADWDEGQAGFLEIDLVGHDGGSAAGEFCQTLDVTDVATGWSEQIAVPTKAQCWVFEALKEVRGRLPFEVLGLDSDNGAEFINHQLLRYCEEEGITFTRSRPYRKNDTCYVEQKNWSIVRRYAGYGRYEGEAACQCLNELYSVLREYVNFFLPSMKLVEKTRDGARVRRRYDTPKTPYRRVLESPDVPRAVKRRIKARYAVLNPAALHREFTGLQKALQRLNPRRHPPASESAEGAQRHSTPAANHPWRRSGSKKRAG